MKSIFRYPGAKSSTRAKEAIRRAFPSDMSEFRECFVGGGSTFFSMAPNITRWINDLNEPLIAVYNALKERPQAFIQTCRDLTSADPPAMKAIFERLLADDTADSAVRYFLLNRCSFNGRVRLDAPWRHRTFFSNPSGMTITQGSRLADAAALLRDVRITSADFEMLFDEPGQNVLVFADPPYVRDTELSQSAKLYEKGFTLDDHLRLKRCIDRCNHKVVLTYDDHPMIRSLYADYHCVPASWTYTGNDKRITGKELVITTSGCGDEDSRASRHKPCCGLNGTRLIPLASGDWDSPSNGEEGISFDPMNMSYGRVETAALTA